MIFSVGVDHGLIRREGSGMSPPVCRYIVARDAQVLDQQATARTLAERDPGTQREAACIRDLEGASEALGEAMTPDAAAVQRWGATEEFRTFGQIYHYLKQLVSVGWLRSSARGHNQVPVDWVVPLLGILQRVR